VVTTLKSSKSRRGGFQAMGVELWFVRHGESKNNALMSAAGGLGTVLYPLKSVQDPYITGKGKKVAMENGERLLAADVSFDLVVSSAMVRTMETSYYMFIQTGIAERVYIVPFISELPLKIAGVPIYENIPLKREEQIRHLGRHHGSELLNCLDFSLVGGPTGDNQETMPPSGDNFLSWLHGQSLVQNLIEKKQALGDKNSTVRIAVVTHSHFLMKPDTLHLDKKPDNADIWIADLHVMPTGTEGTALLNLTDLRGWYSGRVAQEQQQLAQKIEKTEKKAAKKTEKYQKKLKGLGLPPKEHNDNDDNEEDVGVHCEGQDQIPDEGDKKTTSPDEKRFSRLAKKGEKYLKRLSRKQHKYEKKKAVLEEQKAKLVNVADMEILRVEQAKLEEKAAMESQSGRAE